MTTHPGMWRVLAALAIVILGLVSAIGTTAQEDGVDPQVAAWFEQGAVPGSGAGKTIGYISLGEAMDFVGIVSAGIREQADVAGARLVFCDARFEPDNALVCGRQMASLGVDGILNFQASEADAGRICSAYANLPTIAIDIHQPPCERSFMGADNRRAGLLTGVAVGQSLRQENGCRYDTMLLFGDPSLVGRVYDERMGGMVDGFAAVCGEVPDDLIWRDPADSYLVAYEAIANLVSMLPENGTHVVFSLNESAAQGASDAAETFGRETELRIGAQGAELLKWEIACEPQWIAATAFFPERYGRILIPAMIDLLDGVELPPDLLMPHAAVTAENIHDIYTDVPDCETT